MAKDRRNEGVDEVRRKLVRTSMLLGGAFAAGQIPYSRPETKSFFGVRSAWAQPSVMFSITSSFVVEPAPPTPGTACQNSIIQNIKAQVTPVPPVGTILVCTPTTNDPANSASLPVTSTTYLPTDAAGCVFFAKLDLIGNVLNPPLALGSILTLTVTFDDPATFGNEMFTVDLEIVGPC